MPHIPFPPPSKKQARVLWFSVTTLAIAIVLVLIGLLLWGIGLLLHRLSAVLVPVSLALILSYILNPVVEFFQHKRNMSRLWSVTFVFGLAALVILALLASIVPDLVRETRKLGNDLPVTMEKLGARLGDFADKNPLGQQLPDSWRESLRPARRTNSIYFTNGVSVTPNPVVANPAIADPANESSGENPQLDAAVFSGEEMLPALTRLMVFSAHWLTAQLSKVSTWVEFLIGLLLVPVYLFYFLLEKEEITRHWTDYLPIKESAAKDEMIFVLKSINECLIVFFRGQVLVALCVGVFLAAGYVLLGLNYAVLLGVVAGVLGIVPYLGTLTSLFLALIVAGVQFEDWTHPLCVLAIAASVKILEDFVISPKIIGERSGLHPLTIIIAVMVGTTLFGGFLGAMLAIPLTAALRTLMFRYIWTREPYGRPDPDEVVEI
jgi:predicted PurR-regulated permease PerM